MPSFPTLKTGVVAQYPSDRRRQFSTAVLRFLDGSEQRFPGYGAPLRRWAIRLDLLDEAELASLEQFFETSGGRAGAFSFTDPFDGAVYSSCSFDSDELSSEYRGQGDGAAMAVVRENRV